MKITVERIANRPNYCIGRLYINGEYFCDTLEDTDRGLNCHMSEEEIAEKKVYGKTAIPIGMYRVVLSYSPKFKKVLPEILDVKGYSGIRIHSGNTEKDTLGCLLVGKNKVVGKVLDSRVTYNALYKKLQQHKDELILIEIIRKYYV